MVIPGHIVFEKGYIQNLIDKSNQIQPSGIDFTVKKVAKFISCGTLDFDNSKRVLPKNEEIIFDSEDKVFLQKGIYLVELNETCDFPLDIMGMPFPRSSVMRCGAIVHAGLFDPGYKGSAGVSLEVSNENGLILYRNAKIMQMAILQMSDKAEKGYSGIYQNSTKVLKN